MNDASLNERVFDALMSDGRRTLADEFAAANGGDGDPQPMTEREALTEITRIVFDPTVRPARALVKIIHVLAAAGHARRKEGALS
jgi:hypothetical protein